MKTTLWDQLVLSLTGKLPRNTQQRFDLERTRQINDRVAMLQAEAHTKAMEILAENIKASNEKLLTERETRKNTPSKKKATSKKKPPSKS